MNIKEVVDKVIRYYYDGSAIDMYIFIGAPSLILTSYLLLFFIHVFVVR